MSQQNEQSIEVTKRTTVTTTETVKLVGISESSHQNLGTQRKEADPPKSNSSLFRRG